MHPYLHADEENALVALADREDEWERQASRVHVEFDAEEELPYLCQIIASIERTYEAMTIADSSYVNKALFLLTSDFFKLRKFRDKLQRDLRHRVYKSSEDVSDTDIEKARSVPLESLIEVGRGHMTLCPFHKDKRPSFYVKNGFGYCFSCNEWSDSIKYLMKAKGIGFLDAVRALR